MYETFNVPTVNVEIQSVSSLRFETHDRLRGGQNIPSCSRKLDLRAGGSLASSPSMISPCSSIRILSSTTSPVPRCKFHVRCVARQAVTGKFRRAPDQSCSFFTVANVHINNECAKRRSACIALLLLVGDLCRKLGAAELTGALGKAAERETPSGDGERRTSPMDAAFHHTNLPWPTGGVTPLWPLWGPGGEANGKKWPDCCGFVVVPESQSQWLIVRHGSIDVVPAAIWVKATGQTWHYEQWLHLKFAGCKRRRDVPPRIQSRARKIVLYTKK